MRRSGRSTITIQSVHSGSPQPNTLQILHLVMSQSLDLPTQRQANNFTPSSNALWPCSFQQTLRSCPPSISPSPGACSGGLRVSLRMRSRCSDSSARYCLAQHQLGPPPGAPWGRPNRARTTGPACGIPSRSSADPGEKKSTLRGGRLPSGLAQDSIVLKLEKHSQVSLVQKCRILHLRMHRFLADAPHVASSLAQKLNATPGLVLLFEAALHLIHHG